VTGDYRAVEALSTTCTLSCTLFPPLSLPSSFSPSLFLPTSVSILVFFCLSFVHLLSFSPFLFSFSYIFFITTPLSLCLSPSLSLSLSLSLPLSLQASGGPSHRCERSAVGEQHHALERSYFRVSRLLIRVTGSSSTGGERHAGRYCWRWSSGVEAGGGGLMMFVCLFVMLLETHCNVPESKHTSGVYS